MTQVVRYANSIRCKNITNAIVSNNSSKNNNNNNNNTWTNRSTRLTWPLKKSFISGAFEVAATVVEKGGVTTSIGTGNWLGQIRLGLSNSHGELASFSLRSLVISVENDARHSWVFPVDFDGKLQPVNAIRRNEMTLQILLNN